MAVSSQTKETILVADDEASIRRILETRLSMIGYKVVTACDGKEALKLFKDYDPDLVVLDVMMPEISGTKFLEYFRDSNASVPVIMLTAKGEVSDKVVGLELGADDYLAKPFEPRELLARVQSILRRVNSKNSMVDILNFESLDINKIKEEVVLDGKTVSLSTSEFEALLLFANNSNKVLDREFLVENLRGITWQTYDRSVDVLVSRLRNKLGETPARTRFIKTIHGVGYKFIATPYKK